MDSDKAKLNIDPMDSQDLERNLDGLRSAYWNSLVMIWVKHKKPFKAILIENNTLLCTDWMKEEDQYFELEETEKRRNSLNGWLKDVEPLIVTLKSKTIKKEQEIRDSMSELFSKAHEILYEIEDK